MMAQIIDSADIPSSLDEFQQLEVYNALDCCATVEIWQKRQDQFDANTRMTYLNELDMQAPALEMQLRGILLDEAKVMQECEDLSREIKILEEHFDNLMMAAYGEYLNWNSPQQLLKMLNALGFECRDTNRETLENLRVHFWAEPIILTVLGLRDRKKLLDVLQKTSRKRTGRFHASFKVAGTTTGRLSSSKDPFGEGHNLQNLNDRTRRSFIAPQGWRMAYIDLEQAESRGVAYLSGDENYIYACESSDLHTTVCQMVWPDLEWTGDAKKDKDVAEQIFYRFFSYRDMSKRGGHGTNYYGKPATMARHLKVPRDVMENFQDRYFERFPGIPEWHQRVMTDLMVDGWLMTPFGRVRRFFGRPDDDATIRKAIAFEPQSLISDIINTGLWRVWRYLPDVQILAQVHDAILIQYPADMENEIIPEVTRLLEVPIRVGDRTMVIPTEAKVGWNWGAHDATENPGGLIKWDGEDDRERPEPARFLDTRFA